MKNVLIAMDLSYTNTGITIMTYCENWTLEKVEFRQVSCRVYDIPNANGTISKTKYRRDSRLLFNVLIEIANKYNKHNIYPFIGEQHMGNFKTGKDLMKLQGLCNVVFGDDLLIKYGEVSESAARKFILGAKEEFQHHEIFKGKKDLTLSEMYKAMAVEKLKEDNPTLPESLQNDDVADSYVIALYSSHLIKNGHYEI
jgi:hypothetical protein